ncbi:hypothetical protein GF339_22235 [candidate division KSB3 bacterium]|uniref:Uncharacterized protein n=1 Tax=candidate division KSB3 bacterium TaxID=2044937 RepID=A0A9D5K0E9_9BACT|nr:hypothetical protein [candidate division KSB3 bacterium]MBD3327321.1 hypothetical protein [candidate division KSB3 bacterium]
MQKTRHHIFQQMATALIHQQNGNVTLGVAYWENVLRVLPDDIPVHNQILEECRHLAEQGNLLTRLLERTHQKVNTLVDTYQKDLSEDEEALSQTIYNAMIQQCSGNHLLALVYWEQALPLLSPDALIISLAVQDFCWMAHQFLTSGHTAKSIALYKHLIRVFPDFLEGYVNLTLILFKNGFTQEVFGVLDAIPPFYQHEFIIIRYTDLYRKIDEISRQFGRVPYAAIENIVTDLQTENTFYPSIIEDYFTDVISELVNREKRFFEKRRKALEQKAISKTSKQLALEGIALGERVTMAKQARIGEIHAFLHDNDIRIAEVLLNNPNITADDVLIMAQTTCISEILSLIAANRKWGTLHSIRIAILFNPQTLPQDSLRLLPLLSITDLAKVFYKKNIPTEVRIKAKEHIQQLFDQAPMHEKFALIEASSGDLFKLLDDVELDISSFAVNLIGKFHEYPEIIINLCRWKLTPASILAMIGNNPQFTLNIRITFALLSNPKTPQSTVKALLQSLSEKDAYHFLFNSHLPSAVKHCITTLFPDMSPK